MRRITLADGLVVEDFEDHSLVYDPNTELVHLLGGEDRAAFDALVGASGPLELESPVADRLVALGLARVAEPTTADRRRFLTVAGSVAVAGTVLTMALPLAAAASSGYSPTPEVEPTSAPNDATDPPPDEKNISEGDALTGLGTFEDSENGVELVREADRLTIRISANWESVTLSGGLTGTITKTGPTPVGVLSRLDNKTVVITAPSSASYTITISWNGRSSGSDYLVIAL